MAQHTRICLTTAATSSAPSTTSLGTVLYSGPVPPTTGSWLGVEWDDPARGKHDGVHEKTGVRYFTCRVPGAGSFLRPNAPGLSYGTSFRDALHAKYLDDEGGTAPAEQSTFYATSSNFEVEVVPLSKIKDRFKQLNKLREVGLEWEGVNGAGSDGERAEVAKELGGLEVLNLSCSLLPSLLAVDKVIIDLSKLRTLSLNSNRFTHLREPVALEGFKRLTTLSLNRTFVDWNQILLLSSSLPELRELQLGDNGLTCISAVSSAATPPLPKLEMLNLAENHLSAWDELVGTLALLPSLQRLVLSRNAITSIPTIASSSTLSIRHLYLTANALTSLSSVDALNSQLPGLIGLWISENPLFDGMYEEDVRLEIIARVKGLTELEGSRVSPTEREDAELYYVAKIANMQVSDAVKEGEHPRWRELLEKYGITTKPIAKNTSMKSRLIKLRITFDDSLRPASSPPLTLSVLPTLRTLLLRNQIAKLLGRPLPKTQWRLVALLKSDGEGEEGPTVEIPTGEEGKDVGWWGLGDGDEVRVERV